MTSGESAPSAPRQKQDEESLVAADPFTYQHLDTKKLEFAGKINGNGRESDTYVADGYTFHKIKENQMPERQYFTSLMLKGISNVSDIVRGPDGGLYSKDMHSNGESSGSSAAELYADLLILSTIFNDKDHSAGFAVNNISLKDGSHALFDFDGRHRGRNPLPQDYVGTYAFDSRPLEEFTRIPKEGMEESIKMYKQKIMSLIELYDSPDGKATFLSIAARSNIADYKELDALYAQFIAQLHRASEIPATDLAQLIQA